MNNHFWIGFEKQAALPGIKKVVSGAVSAAKTTVNPAAEAIKVKPGGTQLFKGRDTGAYARSIRSEMPPVKPGLPPKPTSMTSAPTDVEKNLYLPFKAKKKAV